MQINLHDIINSVYMSLHFNFQNPQCDLQAQDRCHRIGQVKPVVVYRLVSRNTIDQKIVERATAKRKLEKMIIHKGFSFFLSFLNHFA